MIILKADNRTILRDAKFTFMSGNNLSGITSLSMSSTTGMTAGDYLLLGELNSSSSEIVKIQSVDNINTVTLVSATVYAHSESTKVTRILYNQVRFYHTITATFSAGHVLSTVDINPQNFFTIYEDTVNSTGFGWFIFLNSTTTTNSSPSNPIAYTGFAENSAYSIIKRFLSSNSIDLKLITFQDCFDYLNEGYSIANNELNLSNQEYTTDSEYVITTDGTNVEYDLEADFSKLVVVSDGDGEEIDKIPQREIRKWSNTNNGSRAKYYLRGKKIGFVPLQSSGEIFYLYENKNSGVLSSYYDNVELPNNQFYILNDWMSYRAAPKLGLSRAEALSYKSAFDESIKRMKISSNKQSAQPESFTIDESCLT